MTTNSLVGLISNKANIIDVNNTCTTLFHKFSYCDTSLVVDQKVSTGVNVNLLLYDSTSVVNAKITNTVASYLSVYDNTITSDSNLSLKANISDVNSTFTSAMNSMAWLDTNWDVNNKINNTISS